MKICLSILKKMFFPEIKEYRQNRKSLSFSFCRMERFPKGSKASQAVLG